MFIEVTKKDGRKVLVNIHDISSIHESDMKFDDGCRTTFYMKNKNIGGVKENIVEVLTKIKEATKQ